MSTQAVPETRRPRRRRWPIYLVVLVVLLAGLWLGYWYAAMRVAELALARVTSGPVAGYSIGCPDRSLGGFPLRIDVTCQRATVASAGGGQGVAAAVGGVAASAPLYRPGYVEATLQGPLQVNVPARGLALTASWSDATATASAWLSGLSGGSAHFDGLTVDNSGRGDALPVTNAAAETADVGLSAIGGGSYRLTMDANKVDVQLADGAPPIPELDTRASLVAANVGPLGTDPQAALLAWARNGGTLKIEDAKIAAVGAVVTASGSLSLSKAGLLNGSLLLGYNSIDDLGKLIDTFRPGTSQKYASALQALNVFTRSVNTPDGPQHQTSLTFQDGAIWLAIFPLPVAPIPPIHF